MSAGEEPEIKITAEDDYLGKVAKGLPVAGGMVKTIDGVTGDSKLATSDISGFVSDSASFIASSAEAISGYAKDPISWLTGQGLGFLITLIQPLQDCLHMISGDGPALANAARNFASIGTGLQEFAEGFPANAKETTNKWHGEASELAHDRIEDFARGVQGIANEAGNISQLLQVSSMLMTVIEDLIKSLITEFVTWLLYIWIPALAMSVWSGGASVANAMGLSVFKGTKVTKEATGHVTVLQRLLNKLRILLGKIKKFMSDHMDKLRGTVTSPRTRSARGFMGSMLHTGIDSLKSQVMSSDKAPLPGNISSKQMSNAGGVSKIIESGEIGEDQSTEQTSEDLDF